MDLNLNGTVALVTGARGNLGKATCAALLREGVTVIASDVGVNEADAPAELERLYREAEAASPVAPAMPPDPNPLGLPEHAVVAFA